MRFITAYDVSRLMDYTLMFVRDTFRLLRVEKRVDNLIDESTDILGFGRRS